MKSNSIELTPNGMKKLYEKQYQGSIFQILDVQPVPTKPNGIQSTSNENIQMDKYRYITIFIWMLIYRMSY